jgi:5-(carboxyamino)imidazole ribonucleotide synthase
MGGGQLGRMFAHAAQAMGYKVAVLEPAADCPAGQVAERLVEAGYIRRRRPRRAGRAMRGRHHRIRERAGRQPVRWRNAFRRADAHGVSVAQDRIAEKRSSSMRGEVGRDAGAAQGDRQQADIDAIDDDLLPGILKTVRMGYDGKGQVRVRQVARRRARRVRRHGPGDLPAGEDAAAGLRSVGADRARRRRRIGGVSDRRERAPRRHPVHHHRAGPERVADAAPLAQEAARAIVAELGYVGVLCIEFFVLDRRFAGGQRNGAAPAQQRPLHDGRLRHQPVRAAGARDGAPAAGRCAPAFAGRHAEHPGRRLVRRRQRRHANRPGTRCWPCRAPACTCTARTTRAAAARWAT